MTGPVSRRDPASPILSGPLWSTLATGLGRIEGLSPIEAVVLANAIRDEGDMTSGDPYVVIAAAVCMCLRGMPARPGDVDLLRRAFAVLGIETLEAQS